MAAGGWVTSLIAFGALGVFLLMIPESAGIPVPSEVVLMAAGFAVHQEHMTWWAAIAAGTAGNIVGSLIGYGIGRSGALRMISWRRPAEMIQRCERLFQRRGAVAVFVARLLPLARTFVSFFAGHASVPLGRFVIFTAAGCAIWSAAFVGAGFLAGSGWAAIGGTLGRTLLIGTVAIGFAYHFWRKRGRPADIGAG